MSGKLPQGKFSGSSRSTLAGRLSVGEFGYIDPASLAVEGRQVFINPHTTVTRQPTEETIAIERVKDGWHIRFIGFIQHRWSRKSPAIAALKVLRISVGGANYTRWMPQFEQTTVATMNVHDPYYVDPKELGGSEEEPTIRSSVDAFKIGKTGLVAIRRRAGGLYSVQVQGGRWRPLTVVNGH